MGFTVVEIWVPRSGVSVGECPVHTILLSPPDRIIPISLQMNNRLLPASIFQVRMVPPVQQEKRDGARAEVKRDVFSPSTTIRICLAPWHTNTINWCFESQLMEVSVSGG